MKKKTIYQKHSLFSFRGLLSTLCLLTALAQLTVSKAQCPDGERLCTITLLCSDIFGDGWSGAGIEVWQGTTLRGFATLQQGYEEDIDIAVCSGDTTRLVWVSGLFDNDIYFSVLNGDGSVIIADAGGGDYTNGQVITRFMPVCGSCVRPSGLTIIPDSMSCFVSWNGNGESAWVIYLDDIFQGVAQTSNWLFSGLLPNSYHSVDVAALCDNGDTSFAISGTFRTSCGPLQVPYFNNFDNETYNLPPNCWNTVIGYNDAPKVFDDMAFSDSLSLYFSAASEGANLITTPLVPLPGNQINVTFNAFLEYGIPIGDINLFNAELKAGVMSDPNNPVSFIPLVTIDLMDNQWHEYEFNTSSLPADSHYYVAFYYTADNNLIGNGAIDNLHITVDNGCSRPSWTGIDSVAAHQVWLRWNDIPGASAYNIYVSEDDDPTQASLYATVSDTTCVVNGLSQNSNYWVWVRTVCSEYLSDYKPFVAFRTRLTCAAVVDITVDNIGFHAASLSWQYDALHGMPTYGSIIELYDITDPTVPILQDFTSDNHFTLTGLLPSHGYRALVYNTCLEDENDTANAVSVDFMTESCSSIIGNGQRGTEYVVNTNFSNSYIQSLFLASEMPAIDTISGIAFHFSGNNELPITFDVYLGLTNLSTLSTSAYVPYSSLTYEGEMHLPQMSGEGWVMLSFDQPFVYPAGNNLVVATHNHSGSFYMNPSSWFYHSTPGVQTVEWNNFAPISPSNPSSFFNNIYSGAPDIRFITDCDAGDCLPPMISHIESDSNSIAVQWVAENNTAVIVGYRSDGETVWHPVATNINVDAANIIGLNAATTYTIRVGTLCDGDTLWDVTNVTTRCGALTLPYNENFDSYVDGAIPQCWSYNPNSISYSMGGLLWQPWQSGSAAVLPRLSLPINQLEISFRAELASISENCGIMIGVANADGFVIEWLDTISDSQQSLSHFTWFNYNFANWIGSAERIAISHYSTDDSQLLIDDISVIVAGGCLAPENLRAANTDNASAITARWSGDAANWEIRWDTVGIPLLQMSHSQILNDTLFPFPQLTNGGKYNLYVRAICSESQSGWRCLTFSAGSIIMASNNIDTVTRCGIIVYDDGGATGNYSNSNSSLLVIRPESATMAVVFKGGSIDINPWGGDDLRIFEGEDTNGLLLYANHGTYYPISFDTSIVSDQESMTILFRTNSFNTASGYELIIQCQPAPTCHRPRNLSASVANAGEATLSWSGNAPSYDIYYRIVGASQWLVDHCTSNNITLLGLSSGARYEAMVQGRCTSDDLSPLSEVIRFNAACAELPLSASLSIVESFEDVDAPPSCWNVIYADPTSEVVNPVSHSSDKYRTGLRSFRFSSYNPSSNYSQTLVSPLLQPTDSITLSFFFSDQMYGNEKLRIGYSTTDNSPNSFLWVDTLSTQGSPWVRYARDFPSQTKFLAINYFSDYLYYAYIDDLEISLVPSAQCHPPVISNINESAESVTVFFNASGISEAYITDGVWDDNVNGDFVSGTSFSFSNLSPRTSYTIGLRSHCFNGLISDWVTRTVTTSALDCSPPDNFLLSSVDYSSASFSWNPNDASAWEINIFNPAFNQSFIASSSPWIVEGLPNNVALHAKIRSLCNGEPGPWYNSLLDFSTPACDPVSDLSALPLADNDVLVSWYGHADLYVIEYGSEHFSAGQGIRIDGISDSQYRIDNLKPGQSYDLYVASQCADGIFSNWSLRLNFTLPSQQGFDLINNQAYDFSIYPNPSNGVVTISAPGASKILILDLLGQTLLSLSPHDSPYSPISCSLPSGIFFVKLDFPSASVVEKIVVF